MREACLDSEVVQLLNLGSKVNSAMDARAALQWQRFASRIVDAKTEVTIGVTGKYTALRDSYASIIKALEHAGAANDARVNVEWIDTTDISDDNVTAALATCDGIIVPGGFGVRGTAGMIACVRHVRQHKVPYLGICLGFQMAVIEYARNICGLAGADSTEIRPDCDAPVISILPDQKRIEGLGGNMRLGGQDVDVTAGTLAAELFGNVRRIRQRFRHRYEVDPQYIETLERGGLIFSGRHPVHPIMQILELPRQTHPYFVACQFHPELTSRPLRPQPMFVGLVAAALKHRAAKAAPGGLSPVAGSQ
jgi:CTP synthase